jgi:hypothetical protein
VEPTYDAAGAAFPKGDAALVDSDLMSRDGSTGDAGDATDAISEGSHSLAFKPRFYVLEPIADQPLPASSAPISRATEVDLASASGSVLFGMSTVSSPDSAVNWAGPETFEWTEARGLIGLGALGVEAGVAVDNPSRDGPWWVNRDGTILFGWEARGYFRWTSESGLASIGALNEGSRVDLLTFSSDGKYAAASVVYPVDGGPVREISKPARWNLTAGWKLLPPLPTGYDSEAPWAISSTGDVILGDCLRYTDALGYQDMGKLATFPGCFAFFPRLDGKIVVGLCSDESPRRRQSFLWTEATGMQALGSLASDPNTEVQRVNPDGSVAFGVATTYPDAGFYASHQTRFRWSQSSGIVPIDFPNDATPDLAVSDDGTTLVGNASGRAYRWSMAEGLKQLDLLNGYTSGHANGVTADGSIVFGEAFLGNSGREAVIWDSQGIRWIRDELQQAGVDLKSVELTSAERAWGGSSIVVQGTGKSGAGGARAWVAILPPRD